MQTQGTALAERTGATCGAGGGRQILDLAESFSSKRLTDFLA